MSYNGDNWSQASTRRAGILTDQHGRKWSASIEKKSGFPTGLMVCIHQTPQGNSPPWLPDQAYFVFSTEDPTRFTIDYPRLLAERKLAHESYHQQAVDAAIAREWTVPEKGEHYPFKITAIIGKEPHPIEPIAAAMQGNQWMLGLSDRVDPRLVGFVTKPTTEEALLADLPDFSDLDEDEAVAVPDAPRRKHRRVTPLSVEG